MDKKPLIFALASATLFGLSSPLAKLLVKDISPVALAGLLYLGAFLGLALYSILRLANRKSAEKKAAPLEKRDWPWLLGATAAGGIVAPICMLYGLQAISGFSTSLFLNLEGIATAVIAVVFFRENAGKRLWIALACMTAAGILLAWNTEQNKFSIIGPLLVTLACVSWGIDNNLTRHISEKDPRQIAMIKGLVAGTVSISLAFIIGQGVSFEMPVLWALVLGAFSYGLSLMFFIQALRGMGASRTGAFYSFAPFIGAIGSVVILREWLGWVMFPAIALMAVGVWAIVQEKHEHAHHHEILTHTHSHRHDDPHHQHPHEGPIHEPHTHEHTHPELVHSHAHWPDIHHRHEH